MAKKKRTKKDELSEPTALEYANLTASMYATWTLDCVVTMAQAVAADYTQRPRQYRNVPASTETPLTNLHYYSGNHPLFPNDSQREEIYVPLFGSSDATPNEHSASQFDTAAHALRERASKYVERVFDTGEGMLRNAFRDSAISYKAYLTSLNGSTLQRGHIQTSNIFQSAVAIMTEEAVASAFGVRSGPRNDKWPLNGDYDGNGAYFFEVAATRLHPPHLGVLDQHIFILLQRIAAYGSRTLSHILDDTFDWDDQDSVTKLIDTVYRWHTALRELAISMTEASESISDDV